MPTATFMVGLQEFVVNEAGLSTIRELASADTGGRVHYNIDGPIFLESVLCITVEHRGQNTRITGH